MSPLHPLHTDLQKPERFTYPFCYEPHPLCILAAKEVKKEIERINPTEGKMFGVLVVEGYRSQESGDRRQESGDSSLAFLAAYSGLLEGRNDWEYFVPPIFDAQQPDGYFKTKEREISKLSLELRIKSLEFATAAEDSLEESRKGTAVANSKLSTLNSQLKKKSQDLQLWLFRQYHILNAKGEEKDLVDIWQDYHNSPKIRKKYPLPPGGTGDCCAPKLLQYAYQHGLKPVCMAEFWWGPSPKSMIRHHGQFYPACRGKCKPVLTWMLQGLEVDPNPEEKDFTHLTPEIVYEDEVMAVLNKPSGLLSVPGRTEDFSVASWAKERWPEAIPVHRLDQWTSGLLVVAKNMEAYHILQEQFVKRTVKKRYVALVDGTVLQSQGRIELPLHSDPMNRPLQIVDYQHGKSAVTEYQVLSKYRSSTLIALYPHTGRTHQLRVHCAHPDGLGCPILGDELYGRKDSAERLCLHCDFLELSHPKTERRMSFEQPCPFI